MRLFKLIALLIAVLVPALMIGAIAIERAAAPIYKIRIEAYDPRDLLYGHYLVFQFLPDQSANQENFPDDIEDRLRVFDQRYYIPERHAYTLEVLLRNKQRVLEIEVGLPERGKAFMGDLYIDGLLMREFLNNFEHSIDFNSDAEWQ